MKTDKRSEYATRNSLMKLLTDDEITTVTIAESAACLADGEEYLDLEQLDQGVQQAPGKNTPMGRVLPRKSVHEKTWAKLLLQLPASSAAAAPFGSR